MRTTQAEKSTIGRSSGWALRRAAIRSMHPLAPGPAAQLAARWFVTPVRTAPDRGALAPPAEGRRKDSAASAVDVDPVPLIVSAGERRLAAWSWGRGPLVLLVHGWSGHGLQLAAMARAIAERGHRAVAFDQPAHGRSPGRTATIPEMADTIWQVSEQLGGARALVAHSLGAVAATVALSRGLAAGRAVFLAPPVDPVRWLARFGRALGLPASANPSLVAALEARAGVPIAALQPLALAPALTAELLIVHDAGDREVPIADGEALARAWPGARLVATDGLGHTRLLASPTAVELVADFIGDEPAAFSSVSAPPALRDRHMAAFADLLGAR